MHVHAYVRPCTSNSMCVCVCVHVYVHVHVCVLTHIRVCVHTCVPNVKIIMFTTVIVSFKKDWPCTLFAYVLLP